MRLFLHFAWLVIFVGVGSSRHHSIKGIVKPIALLSPQYYPFPYNDQFRKGNLTEWALLQPFQRVVNGYVIKKPHEDIGYYNMVDYNHRKFLRILANHFGIFGFCFYHYWLGSRPIMHEPAKQMLQDGEPNKPFFFSWVTELPTARHMDNHHGEIKMKQNYSDNVGITNHFHYLLPYFQHQNYIKVGGKPMFSFHHIEPGNEMYLAKIVQRWLELALSYNLTGIHFVRFSGPMNQQIKVDGVSGSIQLEPATSLVRKGGGPSIFPNDEFDMQVFLENNPDLANRSDLDLEGMYFNTSQGLFRTSQFKIYDGYKTLRKIESYKIDKSHDHYRTTVFSWNNAPRRNFTNGHYVDYPQYLESISLDYYRDHLHRLMSRTLRDAVKDKFVFLNAWNDWNEQSVLEPNDVDGYSVLTAVRSALMDTRSVDYFNKGRIVHVSNYGGSNEKHIRDLMELFREYSHEYISPPKNLLDMVPKNDTLLLHVHSTMISFGSIKWEILRYLKSYKDNNVTVYLTVHDYQWLFPYDPNPTLETLRTSSPLIHDASNTLQLFSYADKIIFPSPGIFNEYVMLLPAIQKYASKIAITAHCDGMLSHSYLSIPVVVDKVVNIAFVGLFTAYKGSKLFLELAARLTEVNINATNDYRLKYHVFGEDAFDTSCQDILCQSESILRKHIVFHGPYKGDTLLKDLTRNNIHILMFLSPSPEAYSYAFTRGMNSGLPLVYLARGSLPERVEASRKQDMGRRNRYFEARRLVDIAESLQEAVNFAVMFAGQTEGFRVQLNAVQPTKWYLSHYPYDK